MRRFARLGSKGLRGPAVSVASMKESNLEVDHQLRLDLLREALPYIQRFKGKTFVVKLSGKATEDPQNLNSLAEELALLQQVGIRICVVHGGGKQLSDLASKMGVEQTIIEGRRVTDDATLEMAKMIFAGKINTDILAALRNHSIEAVGLSGVDGNIVHAERRPIKEILNRQTGIREHVDFGHLMKKERSSISTPTRLPRKSPSVFRQRNLFCSQTLTVSICDQASRTRNFPASAPPKRRR